MKGICHQHIKGGVNKGSNQPGRKAVFINMSLKNLISIGGLTVALAATVFLYISTPGLNNNLALSRDAHGWRGGSYRYDCIGVPGFVSRTLSSRGGARAWDGLLSSIATVFSPVIRIVTGLDMRFG